MRPTIERKKVKVLNKEKDEKEERKKAWGLVKRLAKCQDI